MARGRKASSPTTLTTVEAKRIVLERIKQGDSNAQAVAAGGRGNPDKFMEYHRKADPRWAAAIDAAREANKVRRSEEDVKQLDFATFSERYFGQRPHWHHLQWIDVLEGREPRELHEAQTYEPARSTRLLINTPPHHGKTATITINYVTYRICMDPNVRIKVVSKNQPMAKQFLHAVKARLTHPKYRQLQVDYGPPGGWKASADVWAATMVYLGSEDRDSGEKDPTVEALGMGGHIYGARANLIVLDDCIVGENAHQWEDQMTWINREVSSRLGRTGKLLVVGTRIASIDLYRELRNGEHYNSGNSPFTYLRQPMVLEFEDDPEDWLTLWPTSDAPIEEGSEDEVQNEDGTWPAWDGPAAAKIRSDVGAKDWALVYMQQDVDEEAAFPEHAVRGSINGLRSIGPMKVGVPGHRLNGADGLYIMGSIDPSGSGYTAIIVYAVDKATMQRYVLQAVTFTPWTWKKVRGYIHDWTVTFDIDEWIVEKNMYHASLSMDEETTAFLKTRGVKMREHFTGRNKLDEDLGVASLAPLFGDWHKPHGHWEALSEPMIELPGTHKAEGVKKLVEQLITWAPETKNKTDLVMALWFAELRAREVLGAGKKNRKTHVENKYLSPNRLAQRSVISLSDYRAMSA